MKKNNMEIILYFLLISWIIFFIWGIFECPKEFRYYSYSAIKNSNSFDNHVQCVIFYIAGLLMFLCSFPIRISKYLTNKTKFRS